MLAVLTKEEKTAEEGQQRTYDHYERVQILSQGCIKEKATAEKALVNSCLEMAQRLVGDTKAAWEKVLYSDEVKIEYSFRFGSDVQSGEAELYHK